MKRECVCSIDRIPGTDVDKHQVAEIHGDGLRIVSPFPFAALDAIERMIHGTSMVRVVSECDTTTGVTRFTLLSVIGRH